jgi:Kef-type K+ transport system membrane component KefB
MSPTGKQDPDEAIANPEALQKQLDAWEQRQRVKTRLHAGLAVVFLIGTGVALYLFFAVPYRAEEATGAAIAFALIGIFQGILALSSRAQSRAARTVLQALDVKGNSLN